MRAYMDHAATTPARPEVVEAMKPFFSDSYANASSLHSMGQEARDAVEKSREAVARLLGASPEHVFFTSGATESNNTILKSLAFSKKPVAGERGHVVTSAIEHSCVINACEWLKGQGFGVTYVPVGPEGLVQPEDFAAAFRKGTCLASVMAANNEIGTIQPIGELSKIAAEEGVPFHTDAAQAFGKIPLASENTDAASLSAHKFYGPKGVGVLYSRIPFTPLLHGGGHEKGRRAGTENVPGIAGFAKAAELAFAEMNAESRRQSALRDKLIEGLLGVPSSRLNGHREKRLPNNVNVSFTGIEGESLVLMLDAEGIEASTGSACSSQSLKPSHVLMALGMNHIEAHGSLRLTLGRGTTAEEAGYCLEKIPPVVEKLRGMSPLSPKRDGAP